MVTPVLNHATPAQTWGPLTRSLGLPSSISVLQVSLFWACSKRVPVLTVFLALVSCLKFED